MFPEDRVEQGYLRGGQVYEPSDSVKIRMQLTKKNSLQESGDVPEHVTMVYLIPALLLMCKP